jgi:hypothetical protein
MTLTLYFEESNNLNSNKEDKYTTPTSSAVMFSRSSHGNTIEGGEFKNIGGNMSELALIY